MGRSFAMIFNQNRNEFRRFYMEVWRKAQAELPLSPMEQRVAAVEAEHPEYQPLLEDEQRALERDYHPEDGKINPFLHMSLHIALREQVAADRPSGINLIHTALSRHFVGALEAEHRMMDCLAEALWHGQRYNVPPDETAYMRCVKALARRVLGADVGRAQSVPFGR